MTRLDELRHVKTNKDVVNNNEDPYHSLALAIVLQAIQDWHLYCELGHPSQYASSSLVGVNLKELERFFLSPWCADLLSQTSLNGEWLLRKLKDENRRRWGRLCGMEQDEKKPLEGKAQVYSVKYAAMRGMWAQGYSDAAIAGAFGVSRRTVESWRSVLSLPSNGAGITDKLSEEEVEQRRRTP